MPFTASGAGYPANLTLVKDLPAHPLLDGVNSFNGGPISFQNSPLSLTVGATQVGHWSNGQPLIGTKNTAAGRCAGLNFFPPSSDSFNSSWDATTDGARLMVNGLLWSGKIPPTLISAPAAQILPLGGTANFKVTAAGTSVLGYQWRFNGINLPSATNSTLNVTALSSTMGAYSVVVSNLYGTTTSLNAPLKPQLHFLTPVVSGGGFSLYLATTDSGAVAANRASRVAIYATTNLALPASSWLMLTNPVVPSAGLLRADGFSVTNSAGQFFRAVEAP